MNLQKIVKEICQMEKIKFNLISEDWVMALTKNNVTKCIAGYRFPLNDHAIGSIIDDKYALYELCKLKNIPIIEHKILFNPSSNRGFNTNKLLEEYFNLYNHDIVIKPNCGTEGNDVYHITNLEDLMEVTKKLFNNNYSLSICPFYEITSEYRLIVLDNEVKLLFEKVKPTVIGNGKKTIKDLLLELNPYYFKNINLDKYNRVLNKREVFEYDWRFNLSKGATARLVNDENIANGLKKLALSTAKKLNIKFASIDIIKWQNKLFLMEINSGVTINKVCNFIDKDYKIVKEIYHMAINKMFND